MALRSQQRSIWWTESDGTYLMVFDFCEKESLHKEIAQNDLANLEYALSQEESVHEEI